MEQQHEQKQEHSTPANRRGAQHGTRPLRGPWYEWSARDVNEWMNPKIWSALAFSNVGFFKVFVSAWKRLPCDLVGGLKQET
ncbi:hypothetical protein ColKHC_03004 [Colletotrichum higginsianum]|nr:hypothetical protein ColKHC_03004 [Colletotrichum higginsianum]